MKTHLIAYDLNRTGQDYRSLFAAIKDYGTWCHLQGSVWLVQSGQSSEQVRDNLQLYVDRNDELFVAVLDGEAAWSGLPSQVSKWIKEVA